MAGLEDPVSGRRSAEAGVVRFLTKEVVVDSGRVMGHMNDQAVSI